MKKVLMFPGQGSQYRGMGKEIFPKYKLETQMASDILGYDIEELCLKDPNRQLRKTQFTQPALFFVNALRYYDLKREELPDYFIGHSLGEFNALHAAGVFDLQTGLKLVQKRGALMARASQGGMAAVLGLNIETLKNELKRIDGNAIDIANYNTPTQIVISGKQEEINNIVQLFDDKGIKIIPLNVSAPFHSRYMKSASNDFETFLNSFEFSSLKTKVISNVTALPYEDSEVTSILSKQIISSVNWVDTVRLLMGENIIDYEELGSNVLTKMIHEIRKDCTPIFKKDVQIKNKTLKQREPNKAYSVSDRDMSIHLGSESFRKTYGVKYAYVTGGMYRGIASKELVVLMGKAKILGFLGTGGLSLNEIESDLKFIQQELKEKEPYGVNLVHNLTNPDKEMDLSLIHI